jgi:hypothetical protein
VPAILKRLALSLCTGVIFVCWSEVMFWARPMPGTSLRELVPTALAYSVAAYVFLWLVDAFRARSFDAVFLAGAALGWLVEGVVVQTLYEQMPLSLSFTGLAWHALLTVGVGWYLIPRELASGRHGRLACLAALIGVAYGLWAVWWWTEAPPPLPWREFAGYAWRYSVVLILAYVFASRIRLPAFRPSRMEAVILAIVVLGYFGFVTVPSDPRALWVLPPLVGVIFLTLRRNVLVEPRQNSATLPQGPAPVSWPASLLLFLIPLAATTVYAIFEMLGWRPATGYVLYLVTVPAGFFLFLRSIWRIWRRLPSTEIARG